MWTARIGFEFYGVIATELAGGGILAAGATGRRRSTSAARARGVGMVASRALEIP